jgi:putative endonuclease
MRPPPRPPPPPGAPSARAKRRLSTGRLGEQAAADHLRRRGLEVLARNVRTGAGEIDLVAADRTTIAFVEVKTTRRRSRDSRAAPPPGPPFERLGPRQRRRLRALALEWLRAQPASRGRAEQVRFDAIGVVLDADGRVLALEHLEGAF